VTIRNRICACGRPKVFHSRYCARCQVLARARRGRRDVRQRPSPEQRGYGTAHQKLRKLWARQVERGEVRCARCGGWILPGEPWDLDHSDRDRSVYLGPSHAACNRATSAHRAARRGALQLYMSSNYPAGPRVPRKRSREW
jgi:hypothetical protein